MGEAAPRLYLVTPERFEPQDLANLAGRLLAGGQVACMRVALGTEAAEEDWVRAVNHLLPVCHGVEVPLLVTDHHRLVGPLGLDGVHLETATTPIRKVRTALGGERIVGAHGGTGRHRAMSLAEAGADYVSLGPVRAEGALGDGELAGDDLFAWWAEMIETPVVAEGGVTVEDAARLSDTADFVVPDRRIWQAEDSVALLADYAAALAD